MEELKNRARELIKAFKGDNYIFGVNCLDRIGELVSPVGKKSLLITNLGERSEEDLLLIFNSLRREDIEVEGPVGSAKPNAPREDVLRLAEEVKKTKPDSVIVVAGGSGIDAAKAAVVLACLGGDIEEYFGVGKVTERLIQTGKELIPVIAVQTASGSAAHLTQYSNITDIKTAQKKLIVDCDIVPPRALFDYELTKTMPPALTLDGAFDGMAHCLEVFYGASAEKFALIREIAELGIEMIISSIEKPLANPEDMESREALGLGTDLGGYAIMVGGTSGPHLTSFSLVDVLSHGRACAIMSPYYTVFFAPAIQKQLKIISQVYAKYDLVESKVAELEGRGLAEGVAEGMLKLAKRIGFPTTLNEVTGFVESHIERALAAAKNPQLEMKLKNMPVPLTAEMVDEYMEPVLKAAMSGDFSLIKSVNR